MFHLSRTWNLLHGCIHSKTILKLFPETFLKWCTKQKLLLNSVAQPFEQITKFSNSVFWIFSTFFTTFCIQDILMTLDFYYCRNSILAITSDYKNRANFSFNFVSKKDVLTEIEVLDVSKAIQEWGIPVKIVKANFFSEAICFYFNKSLENGKFPTCLKLVNITPVFKKRTYVKK